MFHIFSRRICLRFAQNMFRFVQFPFTSKEQFYSELNYLCYPTMHYQEFKPSDQLRPYVKCYYAYDSSSDKAFEDTVFPSGSMEIIFNLGTGTWGTAADNQFFTTTPPIEFWGQIIKPLVVRSQGKNTMLGIRFYPHAVACFLEENIEQFNNRVVDPCDLMGNDLRDLHTSLQELPAWDLRVSSIEAFLIRRLSRNDKRHHRIAVVNGIMQELKRDDFFDNIENIAGRYGITSRYLQKLFLQYTGLTPKLYSKINRFQNSLAMITKSEASLTAIAYDCGYFDQSHFIRDFKSFTGLTPSSYRS